MQFKQKLGHITLGGVFVMVVLLGIASIALAQVVVKADMPTARYALSTSVVDGKIYAIGGGTMEGVFSIVEEYDPVADTWAKKADMPTARFTLSTSVVDGKIYAIGGLSKEWNQRPMVEMYDPVADTWTKKADMLTAGEFVSTSVVNGKLYAIGGCFGIVTLARLEEYDPATDTWSTKADMPTARGHGLSTSVVNGKIYAIGGSSRTGSFWTGVSTVEEYDPATDTWSTKADMPTTRTYHSTSVVDGKIYVVGGQVYHDRFVMSPTVEEYDPATDTWTTRADMIPTPRSSLSTSVVDGKIYVIGGSLTSRNPYEACPTVEIYNPGVAASATSVEMATWGQIKSLLK